MDNGESSYRRFLSGNDEGLVEIIRDYKDGLIFFLNGFTRDINTAEELCEDTFVKIAGINRSLIRVRHSKLFCILLQEIPRLIICVSIKYI